MLSDIVFVFLRFPLIVTYRYRLLSPLNRLVELFSCPSLNACLAVRLALPTPQLSFGQEGGDFAALRVIRFLITVVALRL